jgi:chorismate synthase
MAGAIMSIPAIKGVETGAGFELARMQGSHAHDEIVPHGRGWKRLTNNAGGLEGGMTNGEELLLSAAMKPIPTLKKPLRSIDITNGLEMAAAFERSDVCALPAACIVGEAMLSWVLARTIMEQFGGDTLGDLKQRWTSYKNRVEGFIHE